MHLPPTIRKILFIHDFDCFCKLLSGTRRDVAPQQAQSGPNTTLIETCSEGGYCAEKASFSGNTGRINLLRASRMGEPAPSLGNGKAQLG
jgi:hypothetical protein